MRGRSKAIKFFRNLQNNILNLNKELLPASQEKNCEIEIKEYLIKCVIKHVSIILLEFIKMLFICRTLTNVARIDAYFNWQDS